MHCEDCGGEDVRGAQSKLARLRTSVAQQTGLPELQRGATWRACSRGAAKAAAAKARTMVNCMLMVWVWWWWLGGKELLVVVVDVDVSVS
jgi:hypothetical protein